MMPRAAAAIFMGVDNDPTHHYTVHMSYLQIYNELLQVSVPWHGRTYVGSNVANSQARYWHCDAWSETVLVSVKL